MKGNKLNCFLDWNRKGFIIPTKLGILMYLVFTFFLGCSTKSFETKEALWIYLKDPDNGYLQKKNINGVDFSLAYKPTDLLVEQELGTHTELSSALKKEKIKTLREKYQKQLYFTLSMSKSGKEILSTTPKNRQEFGAMVNQLVFGMREKIHVFTPKKDTLTMLDYNYPRMYGMSQSTTMLFVYPRDTKYLKEETLHFKIQDLGMYTGEVKFKIRTEKIKKEPTIHF